MYNTGLHSLKTKIHTNMRKSILLIFLIAILVTNVAMADSYTSLWKKVDNAAKKDLPKTELKLLQQISGKASSDKAYGHLLKAQVCMANVRRLISPDSLSIDVARIERLEREASSSDPVLAAVYQSVLGHFYGKCLERTPENDSISRAYYRQSVSHPEKLAAVEAVAYCPFVIDGVDSRIFHDDLLHVLGMESGEYRTLYNYYEHHGNRSAACISALLGARETREGVFLRMNKSKYIQTLDSLINAYADLDVAGELAIERFGFMEKAEDVTAKDKINYINYALMKWGAWPRMNILRNAYKRLTLPSFHVRLDDNVAVEGQPFKVYILGVCNIDELRMTVRKVNVSGDTELSPNIPKDYAKLRKLLIPGQVGSFTRHYYGRPDYEVNRDTIIMEGLPAGVYMLEMTTDNTSVPVERVLLRVSGLYPVTEALPDKKLRLAVLDAVTGKPVKGAKVSFYYSDRFGAVKDSVVTVDTDPNSEALIYDTRLLQEYRVFTATDNALPRISVNAAFSYYKHTDDYLSCKVYTDRRIYRPGQTVHVAALVYSMKDLDAKAVDGKKVKLTLRDANYKDVGSKEVVSDAFGMVSTDFVLPSSGLTGTFSVVSDMSGSAYFSVEEYKRPTFSVEFEKVKTAYHAGDTVTMKGTAKSFAGVPVQNARVVYTVMRRPVWWWRDSNGSDLLKQVMKDTVMTASDGTFSVRVPMVLPATEKTSPNRFLSFDISADVTDNAGETRNGTSSLPLSDRPTFFSCEMPERVMRDSLKTINFKYINNAGQPIDGNVEYYIDKVKHVCRANETVCIESYLLKSGKHLLTAYCGNDTIKSSFVTFTMDDKKVVTDTPDWFFISSDKFPNDGSPVFIQAGAADSVQYIVWTVIAGDQIIEDKRIDLHDSDLLTRSLTYKPEYGDGLRVSLAWVKNGKAYCHSERIARPQPDDRLLMTWTTFRDRLVPGQKETWRLHITRPDGSPAAAQLMATLYDKSLDEIKQHSWNVSLSRYNNIPFVSWKSRYAGELSLYGEQPWKWLKERSFDFCRFDYNAGFDDGLITGDGLAKDNIFELSSPNKIMLTGTPLMKSRAMLSQNSLEDHENESGDGSEAPTAYEETISEGGKDVQMRENLSETAFFYPGLVTDGNGNVDISFTLPESITTWRFLGLAHDRGMNNGMIEGETVAKKSVMVQPNIPRFVRSADKGVITVRLFNTSDGDVNGTARISFLNPETEKEIGHNTLKYNIKKGETGTLSFPFDMKDLKNDGLLICRVVASGRGYSDGEQHYLPILPDKELVTNTVAFVQNGKGKKTIDIDKMFDVKDATNKLTVEYTSNPAWLMIQALPSVAEPSSDNAVSLAAAYYANSLGRSIMLSSPVIRQTVELWKQEASDGQQSLNSALEKNAELKSVVLEETPWISDADRETDQKHRLVDFFDESSMGYRLSSILGKLAKLQNPDGSFSWWPGMAGSNYMTMAVTKMLVRLNAIVGKQDETSELLDGAFRYITNSVSKEVSELRMAERKGVKDMLPSDFALDYLYVWSLDGRALSANARADKDYLLNIVAKQNSVYSIYGKARTAFILAHNNHSSKAAELLKSLKEYTVYKEETGRYFDTPKAHYSWCDYRIPTQVSAIEAIKAVTPDDRENISEMCRWLLSAKRTQSWDTPINSVDAVFAFLDGNTNVLNNGEGDAFVLKLNNSKLDMPKATAGLGYVKISHSGKDMKTFSVEDLTDRTSWGAVYAQFLQPSVGIESASSGLVVKRELIRNGRAIAAGSANLKVGDKITVRITVTADRDYDFVQVSDRRAACLEPAVQLSGYHRGYYCVPKDNSTSFFFDRLSKGRHVIETDYYVDRSGTYHTGICTAQCAYSPEFSARAEATVFIVK